VAARPPPLPPIADLRPKVLSLRSEVRGFFGLLGCQHGTNLASQPCTLDGELDMSRGDSRLGGADGRFIEDLTLGEISRRIPRPARLGTELRGLDAMTRHDPLDLGHLGLGKVESLRHPVEKSDSRLRSRTVRTAESRALRRGPGEKDRRLQQRGENKCEGENSYGVFHGGISFRAHSSFKMQERS
jgi:hypothetical protein